MTRTVYYYRGTWLLRHRLAQEQRIPRIPANNQTYGDQTRLMIGLEGVGGRQKDSQEEHLAGTEDLVGKLELHLRRAV